jgi:hypothetical protein
MLKAFFISYLVTITIAVYILKLPQHITGNKSLVKEYYYDNWKTNLFYEIFIVAVYLLATEYFVYITDIHSVFNKIITSIYVTFLISGTFNIAFNSLEPKNTFFSRWFREVKWLGVIYDLFFILIIYSLFLYLV